jgi:2-polyprenyl-6-methoxyphenol hydroxylase-like FAD-dependent oxidoreductase
MSVRVIVIGGGTGGLCLAHGLRAAGVDVAVYERSHTRDERLQGYRVHINPTGARALHECLSPALWRAFLATTGTPGNGFGFLTERMKTLTVLADHAGPAPAPTEAHHSVSRITLHQVLTSGLAGALHFDKRFVHYERAGDGTVTCSFADGTTASGDVLVGADGANSVVRQQYLPQARRVDTDVVAVAGKYLLTPESKSRLPARLYAGPNTVIPPKGCGMFVAPQEFDHDVALPGGIGGNDPGLATTALYDNTSSYLMWAFGARRTRYPANVGDLDGVGLRELVERLITSWHPGLRRMVADTDPDTVSLLPIRTSLPVAAWRSTNITLLGDAIHSMTPLRGIGANIALRDAQLLCRSLTSAARGEIDPVSAIARYEAEMIRYGFAAVRDSLRSAEQFVSDNVAGRLAFKIFLRAVDALPSVKRRVFSTHGEN